MNILLVAINSKFTHTSLSVRTLSANAGGVPFAEFTINEELTGVASEIYNKNPDVICFSCYIWNIEYIIKLASVLKKMLPEAVVIFGGPEVSFCGEELLEKYEFLDAVIRGEGEETFSELVKNGFKFENINGVTYKEKGIINNPDRLPVTNLDGLVFPYTHDDLQKNKGKLIYYESSRGCPYNCSYCLSSTFHGVRFKSIDKVKKELMCLIKAKPKTIKFVDRTFNADKKRTEELIRFMIHEGEGVTFHFEIEAHTLNDEFFHLVSKAPDGMFRFEIGMQSTNPETLRAIDRNDKISALSENIKRITSLNNVHVHLDLIAGLPYETGEVLKKSFNDALSLEPDVLQLGFLKLLKGTKIREEAEEYSYVFRDFPPYEIISNRFITCREVLEIKKLETLLDKYYNTGTFLGAVKYMKDYFGDYWSFFEKLKEYFEKHELFSIKHSRDNLYEIIAEFGKTEDVPSVFYDILKFDYLTNNVNASTPKWSVDPYDVKLHKIRTEIIQQHMEDVFSDYKDVSIRDILKSIHFETFSYRVTEDLRAEKWVGAFTKQGRFLGEINKLTEM